MKNILSTKVLILFPLLLSTLLLSGQGEETAGYESLDPYYFHLRYITDSGSVMLDVREFFEYRRSRIKDAINIPTSGGMDTVTDTLGKDTPVFLYCYNDYRSRKAAEIFAGKGFKKVYSLEGGIVFWRKEKMPVEKARVKRSRK